eukprot:TRINITY_DN23196_c0_g1_i1.p1 TRINITY_DN23196_c0_g1~~TRINITY_DN23196_c0_g1_i1.p1  ORF type:complete len:318 (+),score=83.36 TRINITY_DN23196_c0_g1_i1:69-1022(+)
MEGNKEPVIIKVKYGDDIRRLSFQKPELDYCELLNSFLQLYPELPLDSVHFEVAGETPIVINNNIDFADALTQHSVNTPNKVFQVTAKPKIASHQKQESTPVKEEPGNNRNPESFKKQANSFLTDILGLAPHQAEELSQKGLNMFNIVSSPNLKFPQQNSLNRSPSTTTDVSFDMASGPVTKKIISAKREEFMKQKPHVIKEALNKKKVSTDDVVEKQELVDRLLKTLGYVLNEETSGENQKEEKEEEVVVIPVEFRSKVKQEEGEGTGGEKSPPLVAKLRQLEQLGFRDRSANIRALVSSQGDVVKAVELLVIPYL